MVNAGHPMQDSVILIGFWKKTLRLPPQLPLDHLGSIIITAPRGLRISLPTLHQNRFPDPIMASLAEVNYYFGEEKG